MPIERHAGRWLGTDDCGDRRGKIHCGNRHGKLFAFWQHSRPAQDQWHADAAFGQHLLRAAEWQVACGALCAAVVAGHDDERILCEFLLVERLEDATDFQIEALNILINVLRSFFPGGSIGTSGS